MAAYMPSLATFKALRRSSAAGSERPLLLLGCSVVDVAAGVLLGPTNVLLLSGHILQVGSSAGSTEERAVRLPCNGLFLMPGEPHTLKDLG